MLYDADCGFCMWAVGLLTRFDRRRRVRMLPLQSAEARKLFGLTQEQASRQLWALDAQGRRHGGAEAANVGLAAAIGLPLPLWLYRLPGVRWCQDRLYRAVAANRHRLSGGAGHSP